MDLIISILTIFCIQFLSVTSHVIQVDTTGIMCWTCPHKANNVECNTWAPDKFCPIGSSVCQTVPILHGETGGSIRVDKRCVSPDICQRESVGCAFDQTGPSKTCVSCCSTPYCNEEVVRDNQTAIRLSGTVMESSGCIEALHWSIVVIWIFTIVIFM